MVTLPIVFSPHLGEMAAETRAGTVPVVDDLGQVASWTTWLGRHPISEAGPASSGLHAADVEKLLV